MGVVLNNSPMVTDNVTDDILVKSSDGSINKTSKAAIIAEASGGQDWQSVMNNGSTANVNTDIEIKRSGDEPSTITLTDGLADVTVGENKITVRDDGTSNIRMTHGAEETLSELILMAHRKQSVFISATLNTTMQPIVIIILLTQLMRRK